MAALRRQTPYTPTAPVRQGIYSQAVVVDRTVYVSGQLGLDVASGQLVDGGVQAQAKQALINMGEILKAAGCTYNNVVKTTVLLADINDFNRVNEVYRTSVEPSELEMDTTMKTHRCNLTIAASDPETGLSPSPWGL
ncbi:2-iminobutanoate/2-iminopropanoate deaminase-like isoform X2 [Takifugu rubripes]|uniref:2-iminobutanoate/2-iminopropanoate deaminase-like isoform X2 n=1 Tax=Takifugu rubripes TaxID=31033 RepID=UPI0005D27290|nr:2-iminobutanoate/2-iminopropanoate deaminase-like isoform X2 [Takifugu rubripes]|eukprot:XP_011607240.1 PREDICTED: ribonuclease UK114-like isoform X3 [Takifugu rubripes]